MTGREAHLYDRPWIPGADGCPVCGATSSRRLFTLRRDDLEREPAYTVFECVGCASRYAHGETGPELLRAVYSPDFFESGQQSGPIDSTDSDARKADAAPIIANTVRRASQLAALGLSGRLLDIGAGRGFFVAAAQSAGFDAQGVELQPSAAAFAQARGLRVEVGDILSNEVLASGPFDVVTLWDVFSGFPNPGLALARVASRLRVGGVLALTAPDAGAWIARMLGRRWPLLIPPGNMVFPTSTALADLLERHGFDVFHISHDPKRIDLNFLVYKAAKVIGLRPRNRRPLPFRASPSINVNLGDIVTVLARRRT